MFNKYRLKGAYHFNWYESEEWYRLCVDEIVNYCKGRTLDVGCGDGLLLSKLPENSVGIDPDEYAYKLAKGKGLNVKNMGVADYKGEYDYVASLNVIEHLDEPEEMLDIVRRAKKGAIIMTLEWQGGAFGEDHKHEYTLDELVDFFKEFNPKPFRISKYPEWIGVKI